MGFKKFYRKILQEHQIKCEKTENFAEAELSRKKIIAFKEIEKEKFKEITKKNHEEQVKIIKNYQKNFRKKMF